MRDTPIGLKPVWLEIQVRRFRCRNEQCKQKTFAEQFPDLAGRRRRHTHRLMAIKSVWQLVAKLALD